VYDLVDQVPAGRVITYGVIATLLGDPRKARQVGWAMAATPDRTPGIPAHRVINARGELSGGRAFGGCEIQRARLEAEGVEFLPDGRVELDVYLWLPADSMKEGPSVGRGLAKRKMGKRVSPKGATPDP
jgi:methylated-DNA-protein-cysteine methyltransferase-like protein